MIGKTLGHYQITDKLGEGGMGVVYKAQDLHLDRFVALKILPPEKVANPERKRRFVQEAKAASALNHPNIITIYDIDQADGIDFIAMEFVEGKTLHQLTRPAGLLPTEALKYAVAVADALARAHTSGIVHRDLKPSNVMVRDDGLVKVLDFGLAKLTEAAASGPDTPTRTLAPLSSEGLAVGTVGYMSPEQIESKHVDRRSDIFSFGVLLYEMLTGRRAFQGDSDLAILANILRETPPPLEGVPAGLAAVIGRCLRKDPVERFQSASDLRAVLEALQCMPSDEQKPPSIAVLPFANLSPDRENEYFSDGLTEELINALAQLPELQVTARTSAFSFKGKDLDVRTIGARLNVDHVLEGSVRRAGNRIRVTAQLIKAADGFHLWSERFDRDMTDVFAVQDEITEAVVDKLRVRLADGRPRAERQTEDLEAYDLYLKGRHQFYRLTDESLARGRQHLEEAIARAPDYAPAYTVLVAIYNTMAVFGPMSPGEALARTRAAATRALKLDGTLGEPHAALGLVHAVLDHNWNNAEREFRLALELDPSSGLARYWYAFFFLAPMLRLPEAIEEMRRVLEIDPLSPFYNVMLGLLLCWQRRHEEAIQQLRSALELDPHHHLAYAMLGITYMAAGTFDQAVAVLERSVQFGGRNCQSLGFLGAAYAAAGRGDDARKLISELLDRARKAYSPPIAVAQIYLGLGEIDQAFAWLDRAVEDHESRALWLKPSPVYESVRSDPRYRELLRRMNFPQ